MPCELFVSCCAGSAGQVQIDPRRQLDELAGATLRFKAECLQRGGSFKVRGAYNKISRLSDDEKKRGVIAASAGNHALGVAFAANLFTLFLFYEGLTLVTYPLVGHKETAEASVLGAEPFSCRAASAALVNGTAGHALESVTKYKRFRHGEAIAYGMLAAATLAAWRLATI